MSLQEIIRRIINEHKLLEGMLNESIKIILSYNEEIYTKERPQVLNEIRVFLDNYDRLKEPHYQFEENVFFPALPERYRDETRKLVEEHKYTRRILENIQTYVLNEDLKKVLSNLSILYEVGIRHLQKENELINKVKANTRSIIK